jgi:PTS system mannose-specific IIA component
MIGVIIATHGEFGNALLDTLRMILGDIEGIESLSLLSEDSMETFMAKMDKALNQVDPNAAGALVLVDMLGGTPFNVSVQLAQKRKIEVVTGVNLPMLIKVSSHRDEPDLKFLASEVQKTTRESIVTTLDLFKK